MSDFVYKNYLLSSRELMVLSACAGMERLNILFENRPGQLSREELNLTVFQLYQKGILHWKNEDSCGLKPEIRMLLNDMKTAKKELQIYTPKMGSPLLCFWNEYTVVTELSGNDKDTVRLHSLPQNDFLAELCDRNILPARNSQEFGDNMAGRKEESWKNLLQKMPCLMCGQKIQYAVLPELLKERNELSAIITIYDRRSGTDQGIILILDYGIYDYMVFWADDLIRTDYYTLDNLKWFLRI